MGKVTIYDGATEAWDNGPGSWAEDPNAPDPITITNTLNYRGAGLQVLETTYKGVVTKASVRSKYFTSWSLKEGPGVYLTDIVTTENGALSESWENFLIKAETSLLYLGTDLFGEYAFQYDDIIIGSSKFERIFGYDGDDLLYGGAGDDYMHGGKGFDRLYGEAGNDTLTASSTVNGVKGNFYSGGSGIDTVVLGGKAFDYSISKSPSGNISLTWETGFKVAEISIDTEFIQLNDIKIATSDLTYVGDVLNRLTTSPHAVHRFYNNRDKAFFYTSSKAEKDYVLNNSASKQPDGSEWPYVYQGATFEASHSYSGEVPLFRFYNTETGHHFFTVNPDERDLVLSKSNSGEWPFNYEGIAFNVYAGDPNTSFSGQEIPVHRFYSPSLNRHFFTASETEVQEIQLTGQWNYEGIGFWGEVV